ncbi:MAG TPA: NAD(P)-dependent oxidoreductase, partial [Candidatus Polarisedimenticolia bacterium]|nr:NAD(P)-dependent oxidoreductase [Candidatus Polarisedimenticolia bacterium]
MRVGFLGLGIMGHAMATNLVKGGHEVTAWNRTPGKLVEGAGIAPTPAAAAQGAEVIWLCVSDTAAVEQILFGAGGIDQSLADGMIIADSSTISPSATVRFAERLRSKGVAYVDAPMTGSKIGAANGTLIFMVGGDAANIDRLNPLFAAMGKKIFRMGETGKGQATKLAMNLQIALIFEGFAEAL